MNKKTSTKLALIFGVVATLHTQAQVTTETFETFTLSPNSYYKNTSTDDWQTSEATFNYHWSTSFGGYWASGSSYTNVKDTMDGTANNLYGNITGSGFSGNNYVTLQDPSLIKVNHLSVVSGFYITNTTFTWKAIKKGNQFSRRFGDTTGTGSGTSIPQGQYPDWFLLQVVGFRNGATVSDTVKFYLADYRPAGTANDYVIKNWQYVNCTSLGIVDSIRFHLSSSDNSYGFMNTPAYFSMDNFTTNTTVGVHELGTLSGISLFPNPTTENMVIHYASQTESLLHISIYDLSGKEVMQAEQERHAGQNALNLQTASLQAGVYILKLNDGTVSKNIKFIKL